MIKNVRFCLSYNLLNAILSPSKFVYFNENLHCCNERSHKVTCFRRKCNVTCGQNINYDMKVRKRAKIRNRYNQAPHLTQDTNGKVTTSQLDITNESQEVNPFPAGYHKALINRRARKHKKEEDRNNINDSQKKHQVNH